MTFLDLIVRRIECECVDTVYGVDSSFVLTMSSNPHKGTLRIIEKYADQESRNTTHNQSHYPFIREEDQHASDDKSKWRPPGPGNIHSALYKGSVLDELLAEGKEYLFVSNSANLSALVDETTPST